MRKDVKIGLAIGAILLAVIIVYAATPHRSKTKSNSTVVINTSGNGSSPSTETPKPAEPATPAPTDGHSMSPAPTPPSTGGGSLTDSPTPSASGDGNSAKPSTDWTKLLSASNTELKDLMPTHPAMPGTDDHAASAGTSDMTSDDEHLRAGGMSGSTYTGPTTAPAGLTTTNVTSRTHTVRAGETLVTIAKSVYGKSGMYLAIEKANPSINPNRLRVGTVLKLPAAGESSAAASTDTEAHTTRHSHTSGQSSAVLDSTRQYKVQPNDSLHKIAVKLYGDASRADEIYTTNKEVIGDDPARLKVGQVLTLPEPPTASASR